jgi:hypothetical protein
LVEEKPAQLLQFYGTAIHHHPVKRYARKEEKQEDKKLYLLLSIFS